MTEAQRLAAALDEWGDRLILPKGCAAELRRLEAECEKLTKAIALLQQHHATAWNRGHEAGMRANRQTATEALKAVATDAWGNTQLTEALMASEAECEQLRGIKAELLDALQAAVSCGMVPTTTAKEGGASAYSEQVRVADQIRAAIAKATGETK